MRWRPVVCWMAVVPASIWALFRIAGWDTWYPATQFMAFTPYGAALSLLPLALTVLLRRWDAAILAGVTLVVLAACVLPRAIADGDALAGAKGAQLRVLTANLRVGGGDVETLRRIVRDDAVDVVALQEVTPEFVARAGDLLPYKVIYAEPGVGGSAIYSRLPLRDDGTRRTSFFGQAKAELVGSGILIESVHTVAPSDRARVAGWRESFATEPKATLDGPLRILAGDFNATLDHSPIQKLLKSGYRDAADVVGDGLVGTWGPFDGDPIPPVTLDRVLADKRIGVVSTKVFGLPNSDHRALLAVLQLP
jgi:endonuclease/exonuclease/phosphatase family metal-dependent hydrolase